MGLDTYLVKHRFDEHEDPDVDVCYWRKCYGIDGWLASKCLTPEDKEGYREFDCSVLKPLLDKMKPYIDLLTKKAEEYTIIQDIEDLRLAICDLDDVDFDKCIAGFHYDYLDYDTFENSIWGVAHTFVKTYQEFEKAIQYDKLYFLSSY